LLLDAKTRRDLELFGTRDGAPGVFDLLNLTRTRGGSGALRTRFENPTSDPAEIRRIQEGVRFLAREGVRFPVDPPLLESVDRYLDASWDVVRKRWPPLFWIESALISLRYRELFRFARDGVRAAGELIEGILPFLEDLLGRDPPEMIRGLAEELTGLAKGLEGDGGRHTGRAPAVFRRDRFLRREGRGELRRALDLLSDLDALLAMAEGTGRLNLVFPEIVESPEFVLEGEGIYHLFLQAPVGNPIRLSGGKGLGFLTGPNMAGKTTYLKAVSISVYLAHVGMGVPATSLRLTPLDALFSSLAPEENIREGLSYFMAEVRRVREVAEAVAGKRRALVVFDEVFRGTNVKDALDASRLVILGFARHPRCCSLFSSHLVELAEDLAQEPGIRLTCFEGSLRDGRPVYDFRLRDGVSDQRFGLHLLEQEGVPKLLP